jgi:hypothetical protein
MLAQLLIRSTPDQEFNFTPEYRLRWFLGCGPVGVEVARNVPRRLIHSQRNNRR